MSTRIFLIILLGICGMSEAATFRNPILDVNAPDPFIYHHTDGYYYWAKTIQPTKDGIEVRRSRILSNWRNAEIQAVFHVGASYGALWAPEIHYIDNSWYIYFALETNNDNANHRMYVIKGNSSNALGEYGPMVKLVPTDSDIWAIDGTVLRYGNGKLYFIWSGWPTLSAGFPQNLYIAPMSDPMTISGPRSLIREPLEGWERNGAPLVEGPQVLQNNGKTFLIFSASGSWTADYCLGIIRIERLLDPLVKDNWIQDRHECIFFRNDAQSVYGTGHASFTTSPDGTETWIIYHAMEKIDGGWENRTARAERISWDAEGAPVLPRPSGFSVDLQAPSGE